MDEDHQALKAKQWVRANKKRLYDTFCDLKKYPKTKQPITVFMAGTPGAGKTEFSKSLIDAFDHPIIRIDADEIREMMRDIGYTGANAHIYQQAVGAAVNNMYGHVIKRSQSALVDGTFAYDNWRENIDRSLRQGRLVEIYYIYQDPDIAWKYVKDRESQQGRAVPGSIFIRDYYASIENVQKAKNVFGNQVHLYLAKHNYQKEIEYVIVNIAKLATHLPKIYTVEELQAIIIGQ